MQTFVGLDCGGTASRVLAVDEAGTPVFRGQSGAANLLSTATETIERSLRKASEGCPPAASVCGAFAGLVGEAERERALALLRKLFPGAMLRAEPDYAAAHAAAPNGTDVTIIAGTGSLVCGPDGSGRLVKTGVGGYLLGDEGSGYRFGRAALAHYLRRPQVRTASLCECVASIFGAISDAEIVAAVYRASSPPALLARLLPAFAKDVEAQEAYALSVVELEEDALAEIVALHVENHLGDRAEVRVALAGGVWKASDRIQNAFQGSLERRLPDVTVTIDRIVRPPVEGAVALARENRIGNGK